MSYSRWSNSYWYTYWCVADPDIPETRATAIFEICTVARFRASEIRKDIAACVAKAAIYAGRPRSRGPSDCLPRTAPTEEQLQELTELMVRFLRDVDAKYPISHNKRRHGRRS